MRRQHLEQLFYAIRLIEEDLSIHRTIPQLCAKCGLNQRQLKTLFKLAIGFSVYQYLLELRMQKAGKLLRETEDSIADISFVCGYANTNDFIERFKIRFGITPFQYRKNWGSRRWNFYQTS